MEPVTPTKSGRGTESGKGSSGNSGNISSPLSKMTIDFDYFKVGSPSDKSPAKKRKTGSKLMISSLEKGLCTDDYIEFKVVLIKVFDRDDGDILRFHGFDGSGEIAITAFQPKANDLLLVLKMKQVYRMTNFDVKAANPEYDFTTGNPLRLVVVESTKLEEVCEEIPSVQFNLQSLEIIKGRKKDERADTIVIVAKNWGMCGQGKIRRRYITVVDETGCIRLTLWGWEAEEFGEDEKIVVGLRNVQIDKFDGTICLNSRFYTSVIKNFASTEGESLMEWFTLRDKQRQEEMKVYESMEN